MVVADVVLYGTVLEVPSAGLLAHARREIAVWLTEIELWSSYYTFVRTHY